jgi:hypothetical protein
VLLNGRMRRKDPQLRTRVTKRGAPNQLSKPRGYFFEPLLLVSHRHFVKYALSLYREFSAARRSSLFVYFCEMCIASFIIRHETLFSTHKVQIISAHGLTWSNATAVSNGIFSKPTFTLTTRRLLRDAYATSLAQCASSYTLLLHAMQYRYGSSPLHPYKCPTNKAIHLNLYTYFQV